ncbi:hypothetical protein [Pontibacter pamirensis]|uniref:hypothetical protein n=1 Tax=Pontibacter pamirensis TaxID=2562824 RepID=UPI001389C427|nr:hypothetical protein [Pontibacter pamirensis]
MEALGSFLIDNTAAVIRPFALYPNEQDTDDELKGIAIRLLYPSYLSTEEVINNLTTPKDSSLFGAYKASIDAIGREMPIEDAAVALELLLKRPNIFDEYPHGDFGSLINNVLDKAWTALSSGSKTIIAVLAKFLQELIRQNRPFEVHADLANRREVALEIMANPEFEEYLFWLTKSNSQSNLLNSNDWDWLLEVHAKCQNKVVKRAASQLLSQLFYFEDTKRISEFIQLFDKDAWLQENVAHWFNPIELGSKQHLRMKENSARSKEAANQQHETREKQTSARSPVDVTLEYLESFEAGDVDGWWRMIQVMQSDFDRNKRKSDREYDIRQLPVWDRLTKEVQARIIQAAKHYLKQYNQVKTEWLYSREFRRPEFAGYKALLLLASSDIDTFDELPDGLWLIWEPIVTYCYLDSYGNVLDSRILVIKKAYKISKVQLIKSLDLYITNRLSQNSSLYTIESLEPIVDEPLANFLLLKASELKLYKENYQYLIRTAFYNCPQLALDTTAKVLKELKKAPEDTELRSIVLTLSSEFLLKGNLEAWQLLWPFVKEDINFGYELLIETLKTADRTEQGVLYKLQTQHQAELLAWLYQNAATRTSSHINDYITGYKYYLISNLIKQGTPDAIEAIIYVADELHGNEGSKWWIVEAKMRQCEKAFLPTKPSALREILYYGQRRFVRSSEELLTVLEESLFRLQKKLQAYNPTAFFLWDKQSSGSYTHKDENAFSDFVKMHLEYDLSDRAVVVNREVEIRRTTTKGSGERTDILVQAISLHEEGEQSQYSVVIEAKGCWHGELLTAMQTQLTGRYLSEHRCRYGLYLVGWFECSHFKSPCSAKNIEEFKENLKSQALQLSKSAVSLKAVVIDCTIA